MLLLLMSHRHRRVTKGYEKDDDQDDLFHAGVFRRNQRPTPLPTATNPAMIPTTFTQLGPFPAGGSSPIATSLTDPVTISSTTDGLGDGDGVGLGLFDGEGFGDGDGEGDGGGGLGDGGGGLGEGDGAALTVTVPRIVVGCLVHS